MRRKGIVNGKDTLYVP